MSLSGITSVLAGSYQAQAQPGQGGQSAPGPASFEQALNQTATDPLQTQKAGHHHHHHHAASGSGASASSSGSASASSASATPDDGDSLDDQILAMLTNIENTLTNIENTLTGSGGSTGSTGSTATVTGNLTAISHVNILA